MTVYTPAEVADMMKCSASYVRRLIDNGELPAFRDEQKRLRVPAYALEKYGKAPEPAPSQRLTAPLVEVAIPEVPRRINTTGRVANATGLSRKWFAPHLTYVVRSGGFVKIGTTSDVQTRFRALVAATPHDIEMVAVVAGGHKVERSLHARFAAYRHRDEWFREEGALAAWIKEGCPL